MLTQTEWVEFWNECELTRWKPEGLTNVAIPGSSKDFLVAMGLPRKPTWSLSFDAGDGLPPLPRAGWLHRLGSDYEVPLCLDERRNGAVIAIEDEDTLKCRFMNSSVEQFGECLVHLKRLLDDGRDAAVTAEELESTCRTVDPAAFADAESWWPLITEQIRNEQL